MADDGEGVVGRPRLSVEDRALLAARFGLPAEGLVFKELPSYEDLNLRVTAPDGRRYVLKLHNGTLASGSRKRLEAQDRFINRLRERGLPVCSVLEGKEGSMIPIEPAAPGQPPPLARMLTFVEGEHYSSDSVMSKRLLQGVGEVAGRIASALVGFEDPDQHWTWDWDMKEVPRVVQSCLQYVKDEGRRELATRLADEYRDFFSADLIAKLPHSVIHSDLNDTNLLFNKDGITLAGILDFGDTIYNCSIFDPAIAAGYCSLGQKDPMRVFEEVLRGYASAAPAPVSDDEVRAFFQAARGRVLLSVSKSAEGCAAEPDNEYLAHTSEPGWAVLSQIGKISTEEAFATLVEAVKVGRSNIAMAPAHEGATEMKVTVKRSSKFYEQAACSFFSGVAAKPAVGSKDAQPAKPAIEHLRISGVGEAAGVAVSAATKVEADGLGKITRIQTAYPSLNGTSRGCAQILIDLERV